jgi:hypothetical protein
MANYSSSLKKFKIKVGGKTFTFFDVALEWSPVGKWVLSHGKVAEMMVSVAAMILAREDALTFEELEHLANTAEMSMAEIAGLIGEGPHAVERWREANEVVPFSDGRRLKEGLRKILEAKAGAPRVAQ